MTNFLRGCGLGLAMLGTGTAWGQSAQQQAEAKAKEGIQLMDEGKLDESIARLKEARQLDPARSAISYELGMAYYEQKNYAQATELLEPLLKHPDATDRTFELLGNVYDDSGHSEQAVATYEAGLRRFPASGRLDLELGIAYMRRKDYDKALGYYEAGIRDAPRFASNYYWAARLYCDSNDEAWGMMYGELFMNLERNSARTAEISKLLYDTYRSQITFKGHDTTIISFAPNTVLLPAKGKKLALPYDGMVYEPVLTMATLGIRRITLNSLDTLRRQFVEGYYRLPLAQKFPNVLFEYQQRLLAAGQLEAYNHWLLLKGDESQFVAWQKGNPFKWQGFVAWFAANPLVIDEQHRLHRGQYEK